MNSLILATRMTQHCHRSFYTASMIRKNYNRQVIVLDGIDSDQVRKFEKVVAKITHDALKESTREMKFSFDMNKFQNMLNDSSSHNQSLPSSSSSYPTNTQYGNSQIINSNIKTTVKNEYNIDFGGLRAGSSFKGVKMPSGSGDMSGLARVAVGVTSLAAGAIAVNKLGETVAIAADQNKHRKFLDEFSGSLKVSKTLAIQSGNNAKINTVEDYIEVSERASKILDRTTNNRKQNVALIATVAASAVFGFAGAVVSIPALVGVGIFGAGASILGGAYKLGTNRRFKESQLKDAEKMKDKILTMTQFTEISNEFRSLPQQEEHQLVNVGQKRR